VYALRAGRDPLRGPVRAVEAARHRPGRDGRSGPAPGGARGRAGQAVRGGPLPRPHRPHPGDDVPGPGRRQPQHGLHERAGRGHDRASLPGEWMADPSSGRSASRPRTGSGCSPSTAGAVATGEAFLSEYRVVKRDGHLAWWRDEAADLPRRAGRGRPGRRGHRGRDRAPAGRGQASGT
jgi:hypothetical protein